MLRINDTGVQVYLSFLQYLIFHLRRRYNINWNVILFSRANEEYTD